MREIKFRAWDNIRKIMFNIDVIEWNKGRKSDGSNKNIIYIKGNQPQQFEYQTDNESIKDIVLMQYTGLKDKNGKEIYFGDILATSNDNSKFDVWNKEDYGYSVVEEIEDKLGVSFSNWAIDTDSEESVYYKDFVEIIGNKYENPELLK